MNKKSLIKPDGRKLFLYSRRPISDQIIPTEPLHHPVKGTQHLRWHPLRGEWVAYASNRQNRTFLPPKEYSPLAVTTSADFPTELPAGDYDVAVFDNLFPSLTESADSAPELFVPAKPAKGACEVVVFTQNPDTSLGQLSLEHIELILKVWADRTQEIGSRDGIEYVMPFENRGVEVGVTLHHPHGQIYSYPFVPPVPAQMVKNQLEFYQKNGYGLLTDFIEKERSENSRIFYENDQALSLIPVCARYPYETWILPKRSVSWLYELNSDEIKDLALALKTTLLKFDHLWEKPFPYMLVLYQAPTDGKKHPEVHTHFQIYPPYRSHNRLKYLAGTEIGAGLFVNDTWPEEKAQELKSVRVNL
jgi:UDPglucose--hexose-1-phosphate uridylyltransferase